MNLEKLVVALAVAIPVVVGAACGGGGTCHKAAVGTIHPIASDCASTRLSYTITECDSDGATCGRKVTAVDAAGCVTVTVPDAKYTCETVTAAGTGHKSCDCT